MTDDTRDTRDRVIRMETELEALKEKVDALDEKMDKLVDLLTQAKGARRAIQFLIWLSSLSFVSWLTTYAKQIAAFFKGVSS